MKTATPEEKADLALSSLDGLQRADVPPGLEVKLLARFDAEFSAKAAPNPMAIGWFWAAATILLAVNVVAAVRFMSAPSDETAGLEQVASYYFTTNTLYQ